MHKRDVLILHAQLREQVLQAIHALCVPLSMVPWGSQHIVLCESDTGIAIMAKASGASSLMSCLTSGQHQILKRKV